MKDKEKTTNQSTDELTKEEQILIVEDERIVSKDIKIRLQRFGYTVSGIAFSGEDAVKKAEELHPDLVLMDIVLEGKMNGINAAEIIRSRFNIPIVYLTAYSDKSTLERAKKTEPFGYILKPFDDRDLSTTIEVALYKHKMENRLKESEERFRQFFENAPEYCYMISSEGKILDINSSALTALGYTKEEIVGKPLLTTTCAPSSIEKTKELFMRWKKTGKLRDEEITIITKKGEERTVLLSTDSVRDSAGKLVHSISIQRDITKRKRAQEAMQESEEFNVALFQHNPIQTIAVDNSGKVANFNMVKKTSGDRLPNIGDVMYKDYAGKHEINMHAELKECIKSKKVKRFPEMKYDGKFLDITLAPFPHGAIITTQDITERKQANEALQESEKKLRLLFEGAYDLITLSDANAKPLWANPAWKKVFGPKSEYQDDSLTNIHPDDQEKAAKAWQRLISGKGNIKNLEYRYKTPGGGYLTFESSAYPAIIGNKKLFYIIARDITKRKKAEERIIHLNAVLHAIRNVNQLITKEKDRDKLLQRACDNLTETRGYSNVWIALVDENKKLVTAAESGLGKNFLPMLKKLKRGELTDCGQKVMKRSGVYAIVDPPKSCKDCPIAKGYKGKGAFAIRLEYEGKVYGFMSISIPLDFVKNKEEQALFKEVVDDIAFALHNIEVEEERKKAEEALKESEEKYRTLTENVNVGIYRSAIKPDGKFIEVNPAFIKILGYKNRDDMLATRILNIYQIPEDRKKFIEKLSRDGFVRNEDLKLKKKDGTPLICSVSAVTIKDKKGKAKYYDGIIENITERKLAEEAMRKSEMTYRALFESGNDPVILFSLNGTIVSANQKAAEILGYNVEELIGMSYKDIIASSEIKDAGNKLKSLQEGKTFLPYERTVYKKNGTEFPSEVNLSLVQDENNKPVFLQSIFRDITERKRADEELLTSREQLRNLAAHLQAVREGERTSIAREIHDDLGQTMTALKMDLSLLGTKLPKDQKSLLKKTKSMSKLIDSTIQTVQRISAELRPGVLDDIGLTAALEWQGGEFQKRTGIKCELTVDPEDIFLDKDCSTAIFRIFQETLTNVARHSKAKWVKVNLKKKARRLELKIRDNGRGITEEQISNSKSFGLIGIRERVQFLGGEVEIRGIQNRGTTLKAWIPLPKDKK
ncbi:MAG: PAS domain S-box protein [Candidatus Aminicenantes bacterium]|nr:PAS domain S-box protein [Candidatus Aminicenantes bacterium]